MSSAGILQFAQRIWKERFDLMKIRQLEALNAVVSTGTTMAAANVMGLTQSAVSRLVSQLEYETGFRLFDRHAGRLTITPEGQQIHAIAVRILSDVDQVAQTARAVRNRGTNLLRIAAMPAIGTSMLPVPISRLLRDDRSLRVSVDLKSRTDLQHAVAAGEYHLGLATLPVSEPSLIVEPLCQVRAVCILPLEHALCDKARITAKDLDGLDLVSISADTMMRYRTEEMLTREGVNRGRRVEAQSTILVCNLVAEGLGPALIHPFVANQFAGRVAIRPFDPAIELNYGLILLRDARQGPAVRKFADIMHQHFADGEGGAAQDYHTHQNTGST